MALKLKSINASLPKTVDEDGKKVETGIFKVPVNTPVMVRELNIAGDKQADLKFHGGACKAVYAYPFEHYAHWEKELGRSDFSIGQFGENFTVEGLSEQYVSIGDILKIGSAVFSVTQPRVPCFKLGIRMGGLSKFPKEFLKSGLVGFYLRVVQEGIVDNGDTIYLEKIGSKSMSVTDIHNLMHFDKNNVEAARAAIRIKALAPGWCRAFERRVSAAGFTVKPRELPFEDKCPAGL